MEVARCSRVAFRDNPIVIVALEEAGGGCLELARRYSKEQELSTENFNMYTVCALRTR
jgi:hypothetical protein